MKVIVDTVIWSLALRRKSPDVTIQKQIKSLIKDQRLLIIGPIRQELLSGYSNPVQYLQLKDKMSYFENEAILDQDYVKAAEFHNTCRQKGIQGSHIDFLICACAHRLEAKIFSNDIDFQHYKKYLPISLFQQ